MNGQGVPQTVFGGRYRLVHKLGQGGMATVWRAEHLTLHSGVAVKLMHESIAQDPVARARFVREARAAATLRSPHVVQILDYGVESTCDCPYIVMELLEGETLAQRLRREGHLDNDDTIWILDHVSLALERAHEAGIVHRDLKPANIFLVDGVSQMAKVLDFGIAKTLGVGTAAGTNPQTIVGTILGTPHYMSPEQVESHVAIDQAADIWAFGVIAFECITGQLPFRGSSLPSLIRAICDRPLPLPSDLAPVPPGFDAWFARAAARDPQKRFSSARQAMAELATVMRAPMSRPSSLARGAETDASTLIDGAPKSVAATSRTLGSWAERLRSTTSTQLKSGISVALLLALAFWIYSARTPPRAHPLSPPGPGIERSAVRSALAAPTPTQLLPSAAASTPTQLPPAVVASTPQADLHPRVVASATVVPIKPRYRRGPSAPSPRQERTSATVSSSADPQTHADEDLGL